ncbi:response regulator [Pleurocapsales cyanobacterium LEGE 10410]|nr:response regulator [Pleurocapsales cyanobacterium LEGE 10410]
MKTILVIEDEAQTRKVLLNSLKFEGFKAIEADNGKTGLELAQKYHPDLIVCDIMMPEVDGYEVLSSLRQQLSTIAIPIIFLTAKVDLFDIRFGMNLGAEDYLTKPCTVDRLLNAIATRLKRKEELQKSYAHHHSDFNSQSFFDKVNVPRCSRIAKVFEFIEANYHQPLELKEVAAALGYSPAYLTCLVRQKTGRTVKQWIIECRMDTARQLLLNTEQSVTQIAKKTGYIDTGYFIRQFKRLHGTSPQLWRNSPKEKIA